MEVTGVKWGAIIGPILPITIGVGMFCLMFIFMFFLGGMRQPNTNMVIRNSIYYAWKDSKIFFSVKVILRSMLFGASIGLLWQFIRFLII